MPPDNVFDEDEGCPVLQDFTCPGVFCSTGIKYLIFPSDPNTEH